MTSIIFNVETPKLSIFLENLFIVGTHRDVDQTMYIPLKQGKQNVYIGNSSEVKVILKDSGYNILLESIFIKPGDNEISFKISLETSFNHAQLDTTRGHEINTRSDIYNSYMNSRGCAFRKKQ